MKNQSPVNQFPNNSKLFSYKDATYRIYSSMPEIVEKEIAKQRDTLEAFLREHDSFREALLPVPPLTDGPEIACRMQRASRIVSGGFPDMQDIEPKAYEDDRDSLSSTQATTAAGVGPMAAADADQMPSAVDNTFKGVGPMAGVAGTIAQMAVEAALEAGERECMVDNGGDIFLVSEKSITIGLYIGKHPLSGKLAMRIEHESTPLAVCSSSSFLGHSKSFGLCDLATVVSADAALADCAATHACNLVRSTADIGPAAERIASVPGIQGVLIIKEDKISLAGAFPILIPLDSPDIALRVTRDKRSIFPG